MASRSHRLAAALTGTVLANSAPVIAVADHAPKRPATTVQVTDAQIQEGRAAMIQDLLTNPKTADFARDERNACAELDIPASVARLRADDVRRGKPPIYPDASDLCVAALTRQAHDGEQDSLYQHILNEHHVDDFQNLAVSVAGSDYATAADLPQRVADAISNGKGEVSLGSLGGEPPLSSMVLPITSGLAFDVGFNSAWANQGQGAPATAISDAKLKAITEKCVAQQGNPKLCFGVGYVQGTRAYTTPRQAAALEAGDAGMPTGSIKGR